MRFRLKVITKNNGTVQYVPQVKMGFFKKWEGLYKKIRFCEKESPSVSYICKSAYVGIRLGTQVECLIVIEEFKVQVLDEEERIGYLKL
jgi:hypothetical protein